MKIGSVELASPLVVSPMAGMTDTAFRRLVKRHGGCGLVVSEMVSSEGLVRGIDRTLEYAEYTEEERPVSIQIFGGDPERMAEAARVVEGMGADVVDINMGCPVPKIAKHHAGCSLMKEPEHAARDVEMAPDEVTAQLLGHAHGQGAARHRQGAGEAVAGEQAGPLAIGGAVSQHRLFQRQERADVAAGGVERAHAPHHHQGPESAQSREGQSRQAHQAGGRDQQAPRADAMGDGADRQRQGRRAQQGGGGEHAHLQRGKSQGGEIDRQQERDETVPEGAEPSGQQQGAGRTGHTACGSRHMAQAGGASGRARNSVITSKP